LIIGGTALVVLLTAVGGWFYFIYFGSTGAALHRAESFMFRRMTVAQLGERGVYRFAYVTNRVPADQAGPVEERFGSTRGEELRFGFFDTEIEPSLGLGMLINPTDWFQNEEIQVRNVEPLDRQLFVERMRSLVESSPFRSLLVVAWRPGLIAGWLSARPPDCVGVRNRAGDDTGIDHPGDPAGEAMGRCKQHGRTGRR
jgi:hypothetical protein